MPDRTAELLELNRVVHLEGIDFDELHARRTGALDATQEANPLELEPKYSLGVDIDEDGKGFRVRLGIDVELGIGEVRVHASARFGADAYSGELALPLLMEYANAVAVMALLPYLRHAIADLTQRVFGTPLVMPIVQHGELAFAVPEDDEVTAKA